jgi:hypothetical protein
MTRQASPVDGGLLPCPCCGAPAIYSDDYNDCDGNPAVECSECNLLSWTPADWNRRATLTGDTEA